MALVLALSAGTLGADPAVAAVGAAGPPAPRLPASSAMALGDWRLPPPGYLDYCLRFAGRDEGCGP